MIRAVSGEIPPLNKTASDAAAKLSCGITVSGLKNFQNMLYFYRGGICRRIEM